MSMAISTEDPSLVALDMHTFLALMRNHVI